MGDLVINGINVVLTVAGMEFLRLPALWLESARHAPLTRGGFTLPDPDGQVLQALSVGAAVSIAWGYRDQPMDTWSGTVEWMRPGTNDQVDVGVVGLERPMATVGVKQAFLDESAEAIVRYCLNRTGLPLAQVDAPGCMIPRYNIRSLPVWQAVQQVAHTCQRATGTDMSRWALWLGADGLHWGDHDEPAPSAGLPAIEETGLLITHAPATDARALSQVETYLIPGLRHSMVFSLSDYRRGIVGQYRALKVRHEIEPDRARTFISYGVEHGRF